MSFSVVIPCFNEEKNIRRTVLKMYEVLDSITLDFEIIVVNDGSTDGSKNILEDLTKKFLNISYFSLDKNYGLGRALREGFNYASKDYIIYTDMDMPFDFDELPRVISECEAEAYIQGVRIGGRETFVRSIVSLSYNLLLKCLVKTNVKDINFALKVFDRKILKKFSLNSEKSFIDAELFLKAHFSGNKIIRYPIRYTPRILGESHLFSFKNIFWLIVEVFRILPEILILRTRRKWLEH